MDIQIRQTHSRRIDLRRRFWLRVVVFPALLAAINAAGIGLIYLFKIFGWFEFRLEGFAWFALGYPISIFFILAIFSILKLRAEDREAMASSESG